ncbi:NADH:ubiquinone oxidoreductase subunit 11 or 4L (chain K) [Archaeoglobus sulfaticallidus PM70-1]|uniref:NADH:ubiquinone oxidoreductase subunit 11 or 4L (Chain K) n=1 Tax=Archaeoglobus sulfaticallidus PM70-1 TaxID=387631 RepID=N0BHI5_9EURY|nr:NADH-quinone oxidoreductase subunit NuoK [Archaeoglobus sulfaticallidus]AGK61777.1 NADH:ubiquinone oxidoreductase subunit 11 or 4L (chain K) [Archaeoglobus sulfaticallidus PM70-1]
MLSLENYILLSTTLLLIGAYGVIVSRNVIRILMCIEIMMSSANVNLIAFSNYLSDISGQILVTFSLAIAGAEASIGFGIILLIFRTYHSTEASLLRKLRY